MHIARISKSERVHTLLPRFLHQLIHLGQRLQKAVVAMRMEMYKPRSHPLHNTKSRYNRVMKKVFAEIGFGNDTFLSTEFEEGSSEYRIPKFVIPNKIHGLYFRVWIFKNVFILSTKVGFETKRKDKNKLKILFGISGENP